MGRGQKEREPDISTLPSQTASILTHIQRRLIIRYGKITTTAKVIIFSRMDGILPPSVLSKRENI